MLVEYQLKKLAWIISGWGWEFSYSRRMMLKIQSFHRLLFRALFEADFLKFFLFFGSLSGFLSSMII